MPTCNICGWSRDKLSKSIIEGTLVSVCEECAKFGKIVDTPIEISKQHYNRFEEIELIEEGYNNKIRKARERKNLTQVELARSLAEKGSIIHNVESGRLRPDLKLAKKLEVFLGITIVVKDIIETKKTDKINFKDDNLTIGDILNMKNDN